MPDQSATWWQNLSPYLQFKDYWYAVVSAFIGAQLGIRWTKRRERKADDSRQANALKRLRDTVDFNLNLIDVALNKLRESPPAIPNFPFDPASLNHWLTASHDYLDDELVRKLAWETFQLEHISGKLLILNTAVVLTMGSGSTSAPQQGYFQLNVTSLLTHLTTTEANLKQLKSEIPLS